MNYDKVTYLFWSIIVLILIFLSSFLINYGRSIISSPNFSMFFGWYTALIVINLFNILLNLIYHFFMKDLVGPRGIKGEIGERGPPGKYFKCGCITGTSSSTSYKIEEAETIKSIPIKITSGDGSGSGSGEVSSNIGKAVVSGFDSDNDSKLTGSISITENELKNYTKAAVAGAGAGGAVAGGAVAGAVAGTCRALNPIHEDKDAECLRLLTQSECEGDDPTQHNSCNWTTQ